MRFARKSKDEATGRRHSVKLALLLTTLGLVVVTHQISSLNEMERMSLELLSTTNSGLMDVGRSVLSSWGSNKNSFLLDDLMRQDLYVGDVWKGLIAEGSKLLASGKKPGAVMEVGMHRAHQCLQAANAGLEAYCVEPSPTSFKRVTDAVVGKPQEIQNRVHLYNVAAGGTSEGTVPFTTTGGTGDHVGEADMWKMEKGRSELAQLVHVPSKRLDEVVEDAGGEIYLLKVDTQGFEPTVFSGLTESLSQHKIKHVIFEYWPRGMDFLADKKDACLAAKLLQDFKDLGYTLYALKIEFHPKAPLKKGWRNKAPVRPLDNPIDNCRWYYKMEEVFPSDEYKMGYWSDIVAVAPGVSFAIDTIAEEVDKEVAARRRNPRNIVTE